MRVNLVLSRDLAKVEGYTKYQLSLRDTQYSQLDTIRKLKMLWDPNTRTWSCSGNIKGDRQSVELYFRDRINSYFGVTNISVEIKKEETQINMLTSSAD